MICINPVGMALYPEDHGKAWTKDGVGNGKMEFFETASGKVSLRIFDKRGDAYRPEDQGAQVLTIYSDMSSGVLSMVVIYPEDGIQESYVVTAGPNESRMLLWTVIRERDRSGQPSKVGAYSAACSHR